MFSMFLTQLSTIILITIIIIIITSFGIILIPLEVARVLGRANTCLTELYVILTKLKILGAFSISSYWEW